MSKPSTVVLAMSGGLDSTCLLHNFLVRGFDVIPVNFQYGSKHNAWEGVAFQRVYKHYKDHPLLGEQIQTNLPIQIVLDAAFRYTESNLMKTGGEIPEGHYEAENMKLTVVPGRNTIFASILASIAESRGYSYIGLGVHRGDHAIYPDCRQEYVEALAKTINLSTDGKVDVAAPFIGTDKGGLLKRTLEMDQHGPCPVHLTRTCYKDQKNSCGKCGSCTERLEAFEFAGMADPIEYDNDIN
jgi:7-cyano-7-deazaguanine synthase